MIRGMAGVRSSRPRSPWASDDHELFRETARAWVEREVVPNDERWQARGWVDAELWPSAGAAGLLGTDVPVEHGGHGGDFGFECVVYEELLQAGFSCFGKGVHEIATHYVLEYGNDEQREAWLPALVRGDLVGAIAMTEPGAGSDLRGITTSAVRDGDHYVVNGSKTFITNGLLSTLICLVVRTDAGAGSQGFTLLMVETEGLEGFTRGQPLHKVGQHAQDTCELHFQDARIPVSASLGEGQGLYQLMQQLPYERTVVAVMAVAALERVIADTVAYANERAGVREAADGAPEHALQARRGAHGGDDRARLRRPLHHARDRRHARHGHGVDGEVVDDRPAVAPDRRVPAALRRLRVHARVPGGARVHRRRASSRSTPARTRS